jgi:hypothetical protein
LIDSLLNLLFRCPHHRLTRPVTPVGKTGDPHGETYVVCLDCGKQFAYDVKEMRIGKPLAHSSDSGVLSPDMPRARDQKVKVALWASLPLAFFAGALMRRPQNKDEEPPPPRKK